MTIAILSSSLREKSLSRSMALVVQEALEADSSRPTVQQIDLREFDLPFCDGGAAYGNPETQRLAGLLKASDVILCATPIYNYDVNSALKNAIELTGMDCWEGKVAGFICAAGGNSSYMSVMALANSLMLDFRTIIIPRFVYATGAAVNEAKELADEEVKKRLRALAAEAIRFAPLSGKG